MSSTSPVTSEDGFTLPEAVMALSVLAIGILMTITPVMSALSGLQRAKLVSIASNLAQAQIEEVRSLPYLDVGFPSSSPAGVLTATETTTVQGIDWLVTTEVEYVGSVTGLDIIATGGDGVPSVADTGVDYKRVTVTISHPTELIDDVIMDTLVAPPSLAAHEGKANVIVNLVRHNPSGVTDTSVSPKVCLTRDTLPAIVSSTTDDQQTFAVIDPNQSDPTKPDYWYYIRLSPTGCSTSGGFPDVWFIHPDDLTQETERVHVGVTQTATATVTIYRPATIEVDLRDAASGLPVDASAYLYLEHPAGTELLDQSSQASTGTWVLTTIDGAPIVPGLFTFSVTANGYLPANALSVEVPSGYPSDLDHVETFALAVATMATEDVDVKVQDAYGEPISGALVSFTETGLWKNSIVVVTDPGGLVHAHLPKTTLEAFSVTSPYGHAAHGPLAWDPADATVTLATPAGSGAILFEKAGAGNFGFRDSGSPDDYQIVLANAGGKGSAAVPPGTYEVVKLCEDGTTAATGSVIVAAGGSVTWGGSKQQCS